MGFYKPINFSGGSGKGVSKEGCEGGKRFLENLLTTSNAMDAPGAGKAAAKLFTDAATGATAATANKFLPKLDIAGISRSPDVGSIRSAGAASPGAGLDKGAIGGLDKGAAGLDKALQGLGAPGADLASGMNSFLHGMVDMASKLADPMGFINAIFEFFKALFSMDGAALLSAGAGQQLNQINMYNTAASAAIDTAKDLT